jgi:hypothetical protein
MAYTSWVEEIAMAKAKNSGNPLTALFHLVALFQDFQDRLERIEKLLAQEPQEPQVPTTKSPLSKETIEAVIPVVEFLLQFPNQGRFVKSIAFGLKRKERTLRRLLDTLEEHLPFLTHTLQSNTKNYLIKKRQVPAARKWVERFKPPENSQKQTGEATLMITSPGHFELHCPNGKVRKSTRRRDLVYIAKKMGFTVKSESTVIESELKPKLTLVQ